MNVKWSIISTGSVDKQAQKLSENVLLQFRLLYVDLENKGPVATDWPNYSKLRGKKGIDRRHCHLKKGNPTYVCCWEVKDKRRKIIEVYYVGTHEKAPY